MSLCFAHGALLVLAFLLLVHQSACVDDPQCDFPDLSPPIRAILCAVEKGVWKVPADAPALKNVGCLIGKGRCDAVMDVPKEHEVPASPPPPDARNPTYQALALTAEKAVPKTWWRDGFADPQLLLSKSDADLPRKLFDTRPLSNKKLKNMFQCVSRQQFMRKALDFPAASASASARANQSSSSSACVAMGTPVVAEFLRRWATQADTLDGELTYLEGASTTVWLPKGTDGGALFMSASEVLEHFLGAHGGVWTGCFALIDHVPCRGALAAAALVIATQTIADIASTSTSSGVQVQRRKPFTETQFSRGYILCALGRGLLHGDSSSTGTSPSALPWRLKAVDFTALQGAYLRLYIDSFGAQYAAQLDRFVPLGFPPGFSAQQTPRYRHLASSLEPVYTSLRNWMFTECSALIDFGPYRPLVAFEEVRRQVSSSGRRRVLVDVGANGFFASPKFLLDSYAAYLPFTDAIMVEPEPHFSASVPAAYSARYNISVLPIYAEVNTGSASDMLRLLPTLVRPEDFVVLKFDVDPNRFAYGPTMEWGFLFSVLSTPEVAQLVDELYIELHFSFPKLYWKHLHSNWEALDAFRDLRRQGAIVHSWP